MQDHGLDKVIPKVVPTIMESPHHTHHDVSAQYPTPDNYTNLSELIAPAPVENPKENHVYRHTSFEECCYREQEYLDSQRRSREIAKDDSPTGNSNGQTAKVSRTSCASCWKDLWNWILRRKGHKGAGRQGT